MLLKHQYKLLSLSRVNAPGLPNNWFWRARSVACRFYQLEAIPVGSSLERFPTLWGTKSISRVVPLAKSFEQASWKCMNMSLTI